MTNLLCGLFCLAVALGGCENTRSVDESITNDRNNAQPRYLFYLHGKIVEDQGEQAVSDLYGPYEYHGILKTLSNRGFVILSEIRPRDTNPFDYAERIAAQITQLLHQGVSPCNITIVGASKGAAIAVLVSDRLRLSDINIVLLAICSPRLISFWTAKDIFLYGRILSIYDSSDTVASSCTAYFKSCPGITDYEELSVDLNLGHGLLYRPLAAWVEPTVTWALGNSEEATLHDENGRKE